MRHYSVLSRGETIVVEVAGDRFKLDVLDLEPAEFACLYGHVDLEADFALPKDIDDSASSPSASTALSTPSVASAPSTRQARPRSARGASGRLRGLVAANRRRRTRPAGDKLPEEEGEEEEGEGEGKRGEGSGESKEPEGPRTPARAVAGAGGSVGGRSGRAGAPVAAGGPSGDPQGSPRSWAMAQLRSKAQRRRARKEAEGTGGGGGGKADGRWGTGRALASGAAVASPERVGLRRSAVRGIVRPPSPIQSPSRPPAPRRETRSSPKTPLEETAEGSLVWVGAGRRINEQQHPLRSPQRSVRRSPARTSRSPARQAALAGAGFAPQESPGTQRRKRAAAAARRFGQ